MAAVNERATRCAVLTFAFLHGGGQGSWVWDETIAALSLQTGGTVHCLALDAPGCGTKRGADASDYAFADTTRELVADIERRAHGQDRCRASGDEHPAAGAGGSAVAGRGGSRIKPQPISNVITASAQRPAAAASGLIQNWNRPMSPNSQSMSAS